MKGYVGSDDRAAEDLDSDPEYTENSVDELLTEEGVAAWLAEAEADGDPNGSPTVDKSKRRNEGDGESPKKKKCKTRPVKPRIYKPKIRVKLNKAVKDKKRTRVKDNTEVRSEV